MVASPEFRAQVNRRHRSARDAARMRREAWFWAAVVCVLALAVMA